MEKSKVRDLIENLDAGAFIDLGLIVVGAIVIVRLASWLLPKVADPLPGRYRLRVLSFVPVIRLLAIIGAIFLVIPIFVPPRTENIIAILSASGIAVGFALKDYASSLIAGIVTLFERPYKPGDWIGFDGHYGEVKEIGLRTVMLVTPDDDAVFVPHLKLWTAPVINSNAGHPELQCVADIFLHPRHDGTLVRRLLTDAALTSGYVQLAKPIMVVAAEEPWGTHYRIKAYPIDARDQFRFITDMTLRAKTALIAHGAEFATQPAAAIATP